MRLSSKLTLTFHQRREHTSARIMARFEYASNLSASPKKVLIYVKDISVSQNT